MEAGKRDQASGAAPDEGTWGLRVGGEAGHLNEGWNPDLGGNTRGSRSLLVFLPKQFALLPPEERTQNCPFPCRRCGAGAADPSLPTLLRTSFTRNCLFGMNLFAEPTNF